MLLSSAAGYPPLLSSLAPVAFIALALLLGWITAGLGLARRERVPRAGLTRDKVAAAAAEVANEVGLERVTVAAVGTAPWRVRARPLQAQGGP